tara:strand:+ start:296 stop:532 length:237 start_codon:yes stop_codon:yes gene_type:complete
MDSESLKWDLIGRYAIAQSVLGINVCIDIKNKVIGKNIYLVNASNQQLKKLVKQLRIAYNAQVVSKSNTFPRKEFNKR